MPAPRQQPASAPAKAATAIPRANTTNADAIYSLESPLYKAEAAAIKFSESGAEETQAAKQTPGRA
eukprot:2106216-Pleurochrysis_carterae.AAC.1